MIFKLLIVVHRWLGTALCVLFLLWFASGIGMMYWGMPAVSNQDRLDRMPSLDPAKIALSPEDAAEKVGQSSPSQIRLSSFDGRPVYRFGGEPGRIIYADNGDEHQLADETMRGRMAAAWTGQSLQEASIESMGPEPDQWTVGNRLRTLRPLWKYSWPDGQAVYIGESGEVLLHTTRASRLKAYLSAVPHWLYFTPLRQHQPVWIRFATYSAMVGVGVVVVGMIIAVWMYSPPMKYRYKKMPSAVPYKGTKRLHTIIGLVFGLATITWTFSGSLAFLPFPQPQQSRTAQSDAPRAQNSGQRGQARGERGGPAAGSAQGESGQGRSTQGSGRRAGNSGLATALRGQVREGDFAALDPRELLMRFPDLNIKELSYTSYNSQPLYSATRGDGTSILISLDGKIVEGFDSEEILSIVKANVPNPDKVDIEMIDQYDAYYQDRNRQRALPVLKVLLNDADATRYYIDPKTATVVGSYSSRNWVNRWLYHGLHSLNFPFLYNHRPLWDIVVITFMLGGTALSLTSLILGWRVLGKRLRRIVTTRQRPPASPVRSTIS